MYHTYRIVIFVSHLERKLVIIRTQSKENSIPPLKGNWGHWVQCQCLFSTQFQIGASGGFWKFHQLLHLAWFKSQNFIDVTFELGKLNLSGKIEYRTYRNSGSLNYKISLDFSWNPNPGTEIQISFLKWVKFIFIRQIESSINFFQPNEIHLLKIQKPVCLMSIRPQNCRSCS